jgi:hypothetical protein
LWLKANHFFQIGIDLILALLPFLVQGRCLYGLRKSLPFQVLRGLHQQATQRCFSCLCLAVVQQRIRERGKRNAAGRRRHLVGNDDDVVLESEREREVYTKDCSERQENEKQVVCSCERREVEIEMRLMRENARVCVTCSGDR